MISPVHAQETLLFLVIFFFVFVYILAFFQQCIFLLDMFTQHTAFLLNKGSQDRRRGILPPAVSNYCYGLLVLV